jgi:peptidoglycan hydrolase CwlO-like protein
MKTRHKPPTLVSMWMLDVFCCALGCVTLLWLLNTREAGEQAKRAGSALEILARTTAELSRTRDNLISTRADLDRTQRRFNAEIEDLEGKLALMTTERDDTAKHLAAANADLTDTRNKAAASSARAKDLDDELARKAKAAADLSAKLATSSRSAEELAQLLRDREKELDALARKAKTAEDQVHDLDARIQAMMKDAAANLAAAKKSGNELTKAARDIQSKLDEADAKIIDLQGQKAKLADKFNKLQTESENRFAGIALTGRRVTFVVDTSGSMKRLAEKTMAPDKWPTVIDTIGKVMRSLPGLEKYQVVVFSEKARYLIGDGRWQDFRGEPSVKQVADALRGVDPEGGTNLHDALSLAFRLRADGLDTVYLFSDGLPTGGHGLTPAQEKLGASEQTDILSRHIRRTLTDDWNRPDRSQRVRVNAVGFFFESPEVGAFLWALARENDGSFVGMSRP